jgi:hypothetical protein
MFMTRKHLPQRYNDLLNRRVSLKPGDVGAIQGLGYRRRRSRLVNQECDAAIRSARISSTPRSASSIRRRQRIPILVEECFAGFLPRRIGHCEKSASTPEGLNPDATMLDGREQSLHDSVV